MKLSDAEYEAHASNVFYKAISELEMPEYIEQVAQFQYENKNWELIDHYKSDTYETCSICGKEFIRDLYIIQNIDTKETRIVGSVCIKNLTNCKIIEWYADYIHRSATLLKNEDTIKLLAKFLKAYEVGDLPIFVSAKGVKKLETMLKRMCNGYDPTDEQINLLNYYIRKAKRTIPKKP